ncbi:MAG: Crp/Fnr family transcriptional regulator [Bacteroidota bacterium]
MQSLLNRISASIQLDDPLKEALAKHFVPLHLPKGTELLSPEAYANHLHFIEQGIMHNYYYHDGRQVTSWFYAEEQFVTSWASFYAQQPSYEGIICLEDCEVLRISHQAFNQLAQDHSGFGQFARSLAEEMLVVIDMFSKGWSFSSAREKYQMLNQYFPEIEQRVNLGMIASFLGISQETLSRIRRPG